VPFFYVEDLLQTVGELQKKGISVVATDLQGKNNYDKEKYPEKTAVVIGNEAKGISMKMRESADILIKIPMCGQLESLNASVAAGIMMYELYRQGDKHPF
jgi:TrmH family RNA methyltransferase